MKVAPHAAATALAASAKTNAHNEMNPAKQAKAAEPAVKGAEFGQLVSQIARAKHAAPPPVVETPPPAPPPPEGTSEPQPGDSIDVTV